MSIFSRDHLKIWLWFYVIPSCHFIAFGLSNEHFNAKHSLVDKLTTNSSTIREILPVVDASSAVNMTMTLGLREIATVDEVNQAIRLMVWLRIYWNNPFLQWNPADYQGIKSVRLDSEHFWTPDIALFNQASLEEDIEILYKRLTTKLIIHYDGNCTWLAPATIFSQCKINVSKFPFDEQECLIIFGSWTYSKYDIDFSYRSKNVELDNFILNGEWELVSSVLENNVKLYGPEKIPYPDVTFHLKIKRRTLYYVVNLIIPCTLIALLSFGSFFLPTDHGERISLVITVLLANSVYMLIVSSSLPETSDAIPVIGIYFLGIIIEIALCLFATCLTLKLRAMNTDMADWLDTLINKHIARFLFIGAETSARNGHVNGGLAVIQNEKFRKISDGRRSLRESSREQNQHDVELIETGFSPANKEDHCNEIRVSLLAEIRLLTDEIRSKQCEEILSKKWQRAAKVLDRFFFFLFLLVYVGLTSYLLGSM